MHGGQDIQKELQCTENVSFHVCTFKGNPLWLALLCPGVMVYT